MDKQISRAHTLTMKENERLKAYREKRDFRRTPEPAGEAQLGLKESLFVIQKHDARNLHYDLRLEVNGVLKSWAIPKGPSPDPAQKRLAIVTEDHPMDYADFEGLIPEGEYGAGKVIVWDTGSYRNITEKNGKSVPVEEAIEHGHLAVWLKGKKLKGGYALNRFRRDKQDQWLLAKMKDEEADPQRDPLVTHPRSVLSERTLEDLTSEEDGDRSGTVDKALSMAQDFTKKRHGLKTRPSHNRTHACPALQYTAKSGRLCIRIQEGRDQGRLLLGRATHAPGES